MRTHSQLALAGALVFETPSALNSTATVVFDGRVPF